MMSEVLASPSQYVLQYLLSGFAGQRQLGCAHLSVVVAMGVSFHLTDLSRELSVTKDSL
jgi:hypothetical protein